MNMKLAPLPLSSNQFASSLNLFLLVLLLLVVVARGEEATSFTNNSSTIVDDNYHNDDDDYYYNTDEYLRYARTMAYLAKPFALFSIICSYVMIREVIADQRSNCGTPITRTLFSVAVADILFSFATFLGMWPIPISNDDPWLIGNIGNQGWCTFQGFMWILGYLASCFFNASLSVLYLLMVRYYWTNAQLRKLEPWQQGCVWITVLAIALYPIPLKLYNSLGDHCGIACTGDECVHVSNDEPHILGTTLVPWICLFISLMAMLLLLCTVRSMENKSRKYASTLVPSYRSSQNSGGASSIVNRVIQSIKRSNRSDGSSQSENAECGSVEEEEQRQVNRRKSTAVAVQGICYAIAFLMTYLFDLIITLWYLISGGYNVVFDHFAYGILMPSAGTFNFLVLARTRTKMKTPEGKFLRFVMCCCCSYCPSWMHRSPLKNSTTTVQTSATTKTSSQEAAKTSVISGAALSTHATEDVHHHSAVDAHHASITENDSALYHAASTELMATEDTDQNKAVGAHITVRIEI